MRSQALQRLSLSDDVPLTESDGTAGAARGGILDEIAGDAKERAEAEACRQTVATTRTVEFFSAELYVHANNFKKYLIQIK